LCEWGERCTRRGAGGTVRDDGGALARALPERVERRHARAGGRGRQRARGALLARLPDARADGRVRAPAAGDRAPRRAGLPPAARRHRCPLRAALLAASRQLAPRPAQTTCATCWRTWAWRWRPSWPRWPSCSTATPRRPSRTTRGTASPPPSPSCAAPADVAAAFAVAHRHNCRRDTCA